MKEKQKMQIRQGDCFLEKEDIPSDAKPVKAENGRQILLRGEATGHHHSVIGTDCEIFMRGDTLYLRVKRDTPLEHQEHAPITLEPGDYVMCRQREWFGGQEHNVMD